MPCSKSIRPDRKALVGISATILPSSISTIRSILRQSTSSRRCSMIITAAPVRSCMRSISSMVALPAAGSKLANGSSKRSACTFSTITPARLTRCFCPPESSWGAYSRWWSISTSFATSFTVSFMSSCGTQSFSSAKAMSSPTVSPINCPSVSCRTVPTIWLSVNMLSCAGSFPPTRSDPVLSP